jgi:hypothetical protein
MVHLYGINAALYALQTAYDVMQTALDVIKIRQHALLPVYHKYMTGIPYVGTGLRGICQLLLLIHFNQDVMAASRFSPKAGQQDFLKQQAPFRGLRIIKTSMKRTYWALY